MDVVVWLIQSNRSLDFDFRGQALLVGGSVVDFFYDVHSFDYATKCGKSLAIRVATAFKVKFRLVANADEKLMGCGVGFRTSH